VNLHQAGGSKDIRLRLLEQLDREYVGHYAVVLVALDGGQPQRSASLIVNIVVTDTNDNVPQFDRLTATSSIISIIVIIFTITCYFAPYGLRIGSADFGAMRQTDGRTDGPDRYITLTVKRGQRNSWSLCLRWFGSHK